jgi:hypothetical protein
MKKWFAEDAPQNAKSATAAIGTGTNGTVNIAYNTVGAGGNEFVAEVVIAEGNSKAMSAAFDDDTLTVTLGTDADGAADALKNTATLIAAKINTLGMFTATASGNGESAITSETSEDVEFSGGQLGTAAIVPYSVLHIGDYYYVNIAPNTVYDANWRRFTLEAY